MLDDLRPKDMTQGTLFNSSTPDLDLQRGRLMDILDTVTRKCVEVAKGAGWLA